MTKDYRRTWRIGFGLQDAISSWLEVMEIDETVFDWLHDPKSKGVAIFVRGDAIKAMRQGRAVVEFDEQSQSFMLRETVEP
jgi:hypothetical protein